MPQYDTVQLRQTQIVHNIRLLCIGDQAEPTNSGEFLEKVLLLHCFYDIFKRTGSNKMEDLPSSLAFGWEGETEINLTGSSSA